jgi:hypothetical protein
MAGAVVRAVSKNVRTAWPRMAAATSAITASHTTPGPLGICDTSPKAAAPAACAQRASSTLAMQQILTWGGGVNMVTTMLTVVLCPAYRRQNCGVSSTSTLSSSSRPSSMANVQTQVWKSVSTP